MNYDIAVIGAGLAGLQCARELARRGLRVVVIDRKTSLAAPVHTTGIFVRKTWEDFPLLNEQLGPGIRDVVLYSPAGRAMTLRADQDEFRIGRMSGLYLWLLDQCVRAGVAWMPGTRIIACDETTITVERGRTCERIAARYVVGADGARSTTARLLGLDTNRELLVGVEDIVPALWRQPSLHCWLDPRLAPGYIAWVANDGHEAHVGVAGYRERFEPAQALEEFRKRVGAGPALERRGGLIPVGGMLRNIASKRGLLIGDAAGAVSPLTAGGLDPALRLSNFAAKVIAAHLGGDDVLAQYSGDRFRSRFVTRSLMRRAIRAFDHPLLLELGCALLRTPPLTSLARHVFFGRGSFPDVELAATRSSRSSSAPPSPPHPAASR
jgi:flavin-dependent dehydrogenase